MIEPAMILVRPQMGENIGAAARAMLNFGLTRMRVVAPRDGWPSPKAVAMASGAGRVLDQAGLFADLPAAVADCDYVLATTARDRDLTKPVLSPEEAMWRVRAMAAEGRRVGILFGPERTGLENEDVALANAIVTVPVNPEFPSLNLAQCVLLTGYEWMRQGGGVAPERAVVARDGDFATAADIQHLADHFETRLDEIGFFYPPDKAPHMKLQLRNMWARLGLSQAELRTFHGMLRQIAYRLRLDGRD